MKLHFSGTHYACHEFDLHEPQDIEVTDAKAHQLLADFPNEFSTTETKSVNISKMNRDDLEAHARALGLKDVSTYDTNKSLIQAITEHRAQKEG